MHPISEFISSAARLSDATYGRAALARSTQDALVKQYRGLEGWNPEMIMESARSIAVKPQGEFIQKQITSTVQQLLSNVAGGVLADAISSLLLRLMGFDDDATQAEQFAVNCTDCVTKIEKDAEDNLHSVVSTFITEASSLISQLLSVDRDHNPEHFDALVEIAQQAIDFTSEAMGKLLEFRDMFIKMTLEEYLNKLGQVCNARDVRDMPASCHVDGGVGGIALPDTAMSHSRGGMINPETNPSSHSAPNGALNPHPPQGAGGGASGLLFGEGGGDSSTASTSAASTTAPASSQQPSVAEAAPQQAGHAGGAHPKTAGLFGMRAEQDSRAHDERSRVSDQREYERTRGADLPPERGFGSDEERWRDNTDRTDDRSMAKHHVPGDPLSLRQQENAAEKTRIKNNTPSIETHDSLGDIVPAELVKAAVNVVEGIVDIATHVHKSLVAFNAVMDGVGTIIHHLEHGWNQVHDYVHSLIEQPAAQTQGTAHNTPVVQPADAPAAVSHVAEAPAAPSDSAVSAEPAPASSTPASSAPNAAAHNPEAQTATPAARGETHAVGGYGSSFGAQHAPQGHQPRRAGVW
ncbi:hypothetical protein P4N68_07850 [Corynebacterium felinum]|uniref:Uncharacterized protein n=1 Tax=Corynebacterium felinum TaxID=131318 RepID=A0ABU2B7Z3_9CORY|nr:hypothetical protein [Corynebacterium felinum]MDF5820991.1 hypothetical protein [Corynebacterium felinum]MDR7354737.1 hypothetical protein [Corynebacterium felinum]WJY94100.1 hypothetical protein CFELI_02290 [Corynebacterium felinum]